MTENCPVLPLLARHARFCRWTFFSLFGEIKEWNGYVTLTQVGLKSVKGRLATW